MIAFRTHWIHPCLLVIIVTAVGMGISSQQLTTLSAAGVGGSVIEALIAEKSLETAAFTVDDIISLKKAGLSDDTIALLVRERSFMKNRDPIIYGKDVQPINTSSINDLMALKQNGMGDDVLQEVIRYQSTRTSDLDRQRSWEMLKNMGIVIDGRQGIAVKP